MRRMSAIQAPAKYVQGRGALLRFYDELKHLGDRWLFICSGSGYKACHDQLEQSFEAKGSGCYRRYEVFGGACSSSEIEKMCAIVQSDRIDVVAAVGGGAAVDTGKAVAYDTHARCVILPTVAATDAPCTGLSVIYSEDGSIEGYRFYPTGPDAVLVDSQVIADAPVRFLIAGIGDALSTYFEGRSCLRTESPSLARRGITRTGMSIAELAYETLQTYAVQAVAACKEHVVTPALDAVIEAAVYMSGVGTNNTGCAAAHSFYNGLKAAGGRHASHGDCVAFGVLVQLMLEGAADEFEEVRAFCESVGLPITLEEIGVTDPECVQRIAELACAKDEPAHHLAGDVTPEAFRDAIIAADALGRMRLPIFSLPAIRGKHRPAAKK